MKLLLRLLTVEATVRIAAIQDDPTTSATQTCIVSDFSFNSVRSYWRALLASRVSQAIR